MTSETVNLKSLFSKAGCHLISNVSCSSCDQNLAHSTPSGLTLSILFIIVDTILKRLASKRSPVILYPRVFNAPFEEWIALNEAVHYFKLAADRGHADAQYNLGICYYEGLGCEKSRDQAIEYLELAVRQKQPKAKEALESILMATESY